MLQRTDVAALDRLLGVVGLKQDAPLPEEEPEVSEEREAADPVATEEAMAVEQPFVRSKPLAGAAPCPECRFFRPMPTEPLPEKRRQELQTMKIPEGCFPGT